MASSWRWPFYFLNLPKKYSTSSINNRNLKTLKVDLEITTRILSKHSTGDKLVVSESGINNPDDIRLLRKHGAHAFLVGTTIMKTPNIKAKTEELVHAL